MKLLIILATLGLATLVVLRRRNPELAERVDERRQGRGRQGHRGQPVGPRRACARQGQERRRIGATAGPAVALQARAPAPCPLRCARRTLRVIREVP